MKLPNVETRRAASLRYKSIPFPQNGFAKLIKIIIWNAATWRKKTKFSHFYNHLYPNTLKKCEKFFCIFSDFFVRNRPFLATIYIEWDIYVKIQENGTYS